MTGGTVALVAQRICGWIARIILGLFILLTAYEWLDVLVLRPEEYERLIGGEAGCGLFKALCSWRAFVLDSVPDFVLSTLAIISLLWRHLPRRELTLGVLAVAVCGYLAWRVYSPYIEASMS